MARKMPVPDSVERWRGDAGWMFVGLLHSFATGDSESVKSKLWLLRQAGIEITLPTGNLRQIAKHAKECRKYHIKRRLGESRPWDRDPMPPMADIGAVPASTYHAAAIGGNA